VQREYLLEGFGLTAM